MTYFMADTSEMVTLRVSPLVWESIAYPYMGFQNSSDINMDIHMMFGCQSSFIHTSGDIHIDIQAGISKQEHSALGIRKQ